MNRPENKANRAGMSDPSGRKAAGGLVRHLRPSRLPFCVSAAALTAAAFAASGSAASGPAPAQPIGLQSFVKRLDEPRRLAAPNVPEYSRTPSFAWAPARGATRYEFQLSTSDRFPSDGLVWSSKMLQTPATAVPLSLPWIADPASLYWRVRAVSGGSISPWSDAQPFTMRSPDAPREWRPASGSPADMPGYVRWHTVDGATGYQVQFVNADKVITTLTNVADEREYYALHDTPAWTGEVKWRVRAVRRLLGGTSAKLPVVSYGPWSPDYTWTNTSDRPRSGSGVQPVAAVSDRVSTPRRADVHSLMPALLFKGNARLHRVYAFSDRDCVNVVDRGSVVGGPAYAPRAGGLLDVPWTADRLAKARWRIVPHRTAGDSAGPKRDEMQSGRYYYAVVPVRAVTRAGKVEYRDTEHPQDACRGTLAKRVVAFGKDKATPVRQALGLSPRGRLRMGATSHSSFYGPPLVTWDAAPAAAAYDVEWSRDPHRWRAAGHIRTPATSALLPVTGGTWWYRVRGINPSLPGDQRTTWSRTVRIRIAQPTYRVVGR